MSQPPLSPLVGLTREGPLYVLALRNGENYFDVAFMDAIEAALDHIEQTHPQGTAGALVTFSENDKIYSNGLQLAAARKIGSKYFEQYQRLLRRILTFRLPTVAAHGNESDTDLSGHVGNQRSPDMHSLAAVLTFSDGNDTQMLALAHDYRVMRSDRGFICMNEVDMPASLTPGMLSLIENKVNSPLVFRDMILKGHRFAADESLRVGLVDETAASADATLAAAKALATRWSSKAIKAGMVYHYLKEQMYVDVVKALEHGGLGFVGLAFKPRL